MVLTNRNDFYRLTYLTHKKDLKSYKHSKSECGPMLVTRGGVTTKICMGIWDVNLPGRFQPGGRRKKGVYWWFVPQPLCVQLSHLWPFCTLIICTFWVIKRNEKRLIIFLHISIVIFLYYATLDLFTNVFLFDWTICEK